MLGRAVSSGDGGRRWTELPQPLSPYQIETCCLPTPQPGRFLAASYALRRRSSTDYTNAYAHGVLLSSDAAGLRQAAAHEIPFRFPDPRHQPAASAPRGCPQSPDDPCGSDKLAHPNQTFAMQTTGSLLRVSDTQLLTTGYGVLRADAPGPTQPPIANYSIAVFTSSDGGSSFEWLATPVGPSTDRPAQCIGGSENHIERLADGSILLVFRVLDDANVMCATRSHTDARTWDTAAPLRGVAGGLSPWGVAPRLLRLSNGLLALTTGRPGLMLWVKPDDGQPLSGWKPWSIAANHNRQLPSLRFTSNC